MLGSLVHFLKKSTPFHLRCHGPGRRYPVAAQPSSPSKSWAPPRRRSGRRGRASGMIEVPEGGKMREECCLPIWTGGSSHDLVQGGFWTIVCKSNWGCSPLSKWPFYGWVKWELLTTYWDDPPSSCLVASRFGIIQLENLGHCSFEKKSVLIFTRWCL